MKKILAALLTGVVLCGCAIFGRNHPRLYVSEVVSVPPGAEIEVDGTYLGRTPAIIEWQGNPGRYFTDGYHVVKAYLECAGCCPQVKMYTGGAVYSSNDIIPRRIFFNMRSCSLAYEGTDAQYTR